MSMSVTVESLQRKRAEINDKTQSLVQKIQDGELLSTDDESEFNRLQQEFEQISKQMETLKVAERMNAASAVPLGNGLSAHVHAQGKEPLEDYPGAKFTRFAMAVAAGKGDMSRAAEFAEKTIGDSSIAAAVSTSETSGGALVPERWADEVIELLTERAIVRSLGAKIVSMPTGKETIPKSIGGAESNYTGESKTIKSSESKFDKIQLRGKELKTLVPMSNTWLTRTGKKGEAAVLEDVLTAASLREDKAFLRDKGDEDTPTGLRHLALIDNVIPFSASEVNFETIEQFFDLLILSMIEAHSKMIRPGWVFSARTYMFLQGLRDKNGNKVYPEMAQGTFKTFPFRYTTLVPSNLGANGKMSEVTLTDFADAVIGETGRYEISFSNEASYVNAQGEMVSAFANDETLLRMITEHDFNSRHAEAIVIGTEVPF